MHLVAKLVGFLKMNFKFLEPQKQGTPHWDMINLKNLKINLHDVNIFSFMKKFIAICLMIMDMEPIYVA